MIGHWMTLEFEEREEVLEFIEVTGEHSGEQLPDVVEKLLHEMKLAFKVGKQSTSNISTKCTIIYVAHILFRSSVQDIFDQGSWQSSPALPDTRPADI
jgi:hypothetical protein